MYHGYRPNQGHLVFMPYSHSNIKSTQSVPRPWHQLKWKGTCLNHNAPLNHSNPLDRVAVMENDPFSFLSTDSLGNTLKFIPAAVGQIHAGDTISFMNMVSLSVHLLGESFSCRFWERTLSGPCNGLSLSPQHFPGVPVSMLSAVYIWRKYVLPSLHRPTPVGPEFMLLRLLVTPRAASQIIFPWSSTLRVQNGSCFTANLYYPSEELKALFTGWFSFRHSALTLHKAFQMIFSLLLLFCFPEASIVKILAFSYHRKRQ